MWEFANSFVSDFALKFDHCVSQTERNKEQRNPGLQKKIYRKGVVELQNRVVVTPLISSYINLGINKLCPLQTGEINRVKPRSVLGRVLRDLDPFGLE